MAHWRPLYRYSNKIEQVDKGRREYKNGYPLWIISNLSCKTEICLHYYPSLKRIIIPVQPDIGKGAKNIFLQRNKPLLSAIRDCLHILEISTKNPTACKELVTGWPYYIGVKDAFSHGIGGIIMGEGKACIPTFFPLTWQDDIKELFHKVDIKKSDLEMAGLLMSWLARHFSLCPLPQSSLATGPQLF